MATDYVASYCACGAMRQVPRAEADDYMCPHCRAQKSRQDKTSHERELEEEGIYIDDGYPTEKELNFN